MTINECNNCHFYCLDGATACKVFDGSGCENWQPMTNIDWIRQLDDTQLAKLLSKLIDGEVIDDSHLPVCATDPETDTSHCLSADCFKCVLTILNWLHADQEET